MVDHPTPLNPGLDGHDFSVVREKITIFPDTISREIIDGIRDDQKVVFVSIGPGETRVNVIDDEGRSLSAWTAVFGWSSLCEIEIEHDGAPLRATNIGMLTRALRGSLRLYGNIVDTSGFARLSGTYFRGALSHILDQTIGDAREYDRIILAAPSWLHVVLGDSLQIRPHIDPEIQDL